MKKVIIFTRVIHPSKIVFFNYFNDFFKDKFIFKVIYTTENESIRNWDMKALKNTIKFDYRILKSKQISVNSKKDKHFFHFNFDINKVLGEEKPDIVIHIGWSGLSAWSSLFWSKKNNKRYILWSESTTYEKSWRRFITKPIVRYLVKKSDNYISLGTRSNEYLQILGAKKDRIFKLINTVNTDYFLEQSILLKSEKEKLRKKYGIKTKYVLLYIGRFVNGKGIYETLEGFHEFQKENSNISLLMVGNGEEQKRLENIINEKDIKNVFFPGFIQQDKIGELYSIADIFTLPSSEEVWGLVINEAMCFGLPILTAYRVGASVDLVEEGKNGYIMKENTKKEFSKGLKFIFSKGLIEKNNSLELIKENRIEKILKNLKI